MLDALQLALDHPTNNATPSLSQSTTNDAAFQLIARLVRLELTLATPSRTLIQISLTLMSQQIMNYEFGLDTITMQVH